MKQVTPLQVRPQFTQCCSIMTSHTLEQHSCIKQCRCSMAGFKSRPTMLVTSWVLPCFISRLETTACCIQVHTAQHLWLLPAELTLKPGPPCPGDYNMAPNRHLSAAWIDRMCPDVVITESTYATTVQPTKRLRERSFVQQVKQCVDGGGKVRTEACIKRCVCVIIALVIHQNPHNCIVVAPCSTAIDSTQVLIPVFALGRAQELCILLDSFRPSFSVRSRSVRLSPFPSSTVSLLLISRFT